MGFWKKLFGGKKQELPEEEDWEEIVYARDTVDFSREDQRSRYVMDCLEQAAEADHEVELLTGEYSLVTAYLMDMEEIEALPPLQKDSVLHTAKQLQTLEKERDRFRGREGRMDDGEFYQIRGQEEEIEEGIRKMKECESQAALIKQDLVRIDREKQGFTYRKQELSKLQANFRGMAVIFAGALVLCLIMLFLIQTMLEMDVRIGYFAAVLAAAIALTVLSVKNMDAAKEEEKLRRGINKLIRLQNKVKIRYVNNTHLLDYLYIKYNTDSCSKLEKRWESYLAEKEDRIQYEETEAKLDVYRDRLVSQLSGFRIRDPHRWIGQVDAILDDREMVEIRHELILRRQALRKQMDYNNKVAETAHEEIRKIVELYPKYAQEILEMVDGYRRL